MTFNWITIRILTIACLALILPGLVLSIDGCAKKEGNTSEDIAQTQVPPGEQAQNAREDMEDMAEATGQNDVVKAGSRVAVHYRGTFSDGSVFDESKEDRPLVFVAGTGQMIPGFENAVLGMKVGEEKTVTIPSAEAYGPKNPKMIRNIPRSSFPEDFEAAEGDPISIRNSTGLTLRGVLVSMAADSLLIDFNHPLAGKDLTFDLRVVSIQ